MIRRFGLALVTCAFSIAALFVTVGRAQSVPGLDRIQNQAELDHAGLALDAALFDSYNKCDLEKFESFFDDDVEFYHDQGGLTLGKKALTESVKNNICMRKDDARVGTGNAKGLLHEGLWDARDWCPPISSPRPRGDGNRRRTVRPPLAV